MERCRRLGAAHGGVAGTSADFIFRFLRSDKKVQIVLGEWKYTELYPKRSDPAESAANTTRTNTYQPHLSASDCQLDLRNFAARALLAEPFYQLMRLHLLAAEMMRAEEMEAELVTVLHVAPHANRQLMDWSTSKNFSGRGSSLHQVWSSFVRDGFFRGVDTERFLDVALNTAPSSSWAAYMRQRYAWAREPSLPVGVE